MRNALRLLALATAALVALPAAAQTEDGTPPQPEIAAGGDSLTIAVGVATIPDFEGADGNRIIPSGLIRGSYKGINFSTRGFYLFVDLIPDQAGPGFDLQLGPVVGPNFDRTRRKTIDNARVAALGTRKTAIEVGGYAGISRTGVITSDYDTLGASVSYVQDVNHAHRSYTITPQIEYGTPLSRKAYVGVSANAVYAGGEYADAYFSVTPAGSLLSTLPTYNASKGWKNYSVSALATHALTGDLLHGLSLGGAVSYSRLLGDFARSPIVAVAGDRDQWSATVGLAYTF